MVKRSEHAVADIVNPDSSEQIIALAALFEGKFSIDWLVELTQSKVSKVIGVLEEAVKKKEMIHRGAGIYYFDCKSGLADLRPFFNDDARRKMHDRIATILIRDLPEKGEKALLISRHLLHTTNDLERCKYLSRAGDEYRATFNTQEAFQCYTKVLEDLSVLSGDEADALFTTIAIKFSKISTGRQDTGKVIETLEDAKSRAAKLGNISAEALLEMHIAKNEWLRAEYSNAMTHFNKGWSIAGRLDDPKLRHSATTFGTFFLFWQGRFREAVQSYEDSVNDVEKFPHGRFPLLATITLGYCYAQIGQVTQGLGMIDAIRTLCLDRGDLNLAAYTAGNMGSIMLDIQKPDDALDYIQLASKEATKENNNWVLIAGRLVSAHCYFLKGDLKKCIRHLREFLKKRSEIHIGVNLYPYLFYLLWEMEQGNLPKIKGYSLRHEVEQSIHIQNIFVKGIAYRYQALLLRSKGAPHEEVISSLNKSREWLSESGHQFELAQTTMELARLQLLIKNRKSAWEMANSASKMLSPYTYRMLPDDLRSLIEIPPINEQLLEEILQLGQKIADIAYDQTLVKQVLTAVNRMTGAERAAMFLLDENEGTPHFRLRASKNLTSSQINHPDFSSSLRMLETVAQSGKGMIMGSESEKPASFFSNDNIRSRICVPMVLRDKVVGVLYHDNRLLSSAFKESDLKLLSFFAAQAAFALDNANAYNEIKRLNQRLSQEKEYYKEEHTQCIISNDIIGDSPPIQKVMAQAEKVAQTEATALILGQTGVGKELVARAIHNQSQRKDKPFIRVHCSALPENLITSELFGHEKGAFTGAIARRIGRFELADSGTLFLDEIGDIPHDVQVRLLRVLQTKEFERVGGSETLQSDFRLIAATNKNLEEEVAAKRFRADLYYRLNVFPIDVPPLSERRDDIKLLAHHFLNLYSVKMRKNFTRIPNDELLKLKQYGWPGNVRELENVIERGIILNTGPVFRTPELNAKQEQQQSNGKQASLQEVEKRHIIWALQQTAGKIRGPGGAAELLEIHPSTLHFRMKKLNIKKPK
ncbi:MAG: sigma 54-interacting transcriptional regulator [Deltaproteobacteria bacterium]|jgi:formate hydrogenlyase transcriptional activator|nr:sigma 54-interacting transcriptional regulator [Deltaproteobacteria bacterium]MBT4641716.1 sigma 54-interacting transcriptional regulator [Deltaproteobacteria bacterium]MBT6499111.1 sigma 54-interacting transcriptional regulator [Deltaproteobacteria bacterium]MBT6612137.1 sigma 54-interacting transcriptional regulator [Deltaproteobacteria bacterium]MBT7151560.1 sigma 54-interacting transcriptional regulator [Deltaproteobacteria bacterium]